MEKSRYTLVHHPDADPAELAKILDQIDPEILASEDQGEILPRTRHIGPCRICGQIAELTREHIPPRSAFNKERVVHTAGEELFEDGIMTEPSAGTYIQGGLSGYVLCTSCNNFTGTNYVRAYQEWVREAAGCIFHIHDNQLSLDEIDALDGHHPVDATFRQAYPARFIRQVIAMMLCISGGPDLSTRYPDLRELALGGTPRQLPDPLKIYLDLYAGPVARFAGGKFGQGIIRNGVPRWILQLSFPPLSLLMILDGPPDPSLGCDITWFTECDLDQCEDIEFTEFIIGFGHSAAPTDFRTRGQLNAPRESPDGH